MKKLFAILAAALFVVACDSKQKDEPKTIEEQLLEYMAEIEEATEARDEVKGYEVHEAYGRWVDGLIAEQRGDEFREVWEKHKDYIQKTMSVFDGDGAGFRYDPEEDCEVEVAMVYSNMYDGYLNVRAEPSTKSQVLGTLRNGPEGAELLGVEGKWTKVLVNGVEGYVWSAYLQSVPSEPVYISASAVVGEWLWCYKNGQCDTYTIESDGKFYQTGCLSMEEKEGTWYLSGHNIILKYSDGRTIACNVTGNTIIVDDYEYERI